MIGQDRPMIDIVVYLVDEWDTFHRRPMLTAFAKNAEGIARILCLEPPICPPAASLFQRQRYRRWHTKPMLRQVLPNMWVYSPFTWLPNRMSKNALTSQLCRGILRKQVASALSKMGGSNDKRVAWVFRPEQYRWLGLAGESHVLYECYDEYWLNSCTGEPLPQAKKDELRLMKQTDIVFTTSESLWQKRRELHPKVYLVPNGVDFALFSQSQRDEIPLPSELSQIKRPIIGYAGQLGQFIDWELLVYLTERRCDWSFVFLGDLDAATPKVKALQAKANIYFLGRKPHNLVPNYSRGFDVAILPLLTNAYLQCSNPLTLWEQLAVGNVVVATNLREIRRLNEFVFGAGSKEEFLSCIDCTLVEDNRGRVAKGIDAAKEHSWDTITKRALDILLGELR